MAHKMASTIHPVVMYPFKQPRELESLDLLYSHLKGLGEDDRFGEPVTIVNNQTKYQNSKPREVKSPARSKAFHEAISDIVKPVSKVTSVWSVDTCSMWLHGLGDAFEKARVSGDNHDVFWLIPGDFDFTTSSGRAALEKLASIPESVYAGDCDICLGEIDVPVNSAKQLIDTYGTYGLLYNWFPAEAQGIRKITSKPRTEFFAISYRTLDTALIDSRWYAYEQTLMILLQNMKGSDTVLPILSEHLGEISDEESTRSSLSSAMQQVERTERALKLFWREKAESEGRDDWYDEFRVLSSQSESIRTAAMVILRRLLPPK